MDLNQVKPLFYLTSIVDSIQKLAADMEQNMYLLGATGVIEDASQGLQGLLHSMKSANINVWIATGDKVENTLALARSCKLVLPEMRIMMQTNSHSA